MIRSLYSKFFVVVVLLFLGQNTYATPFTQNNLQGGEVSDGLDVSSVRYGEHAEFVRIVFDVAYWKGYESEMIGKAAKSTGSYTSVISDNHREIILGLHGFRAFSASISELNSVLKNFVVFSKITDEAYADDSAVFLKVSSGSPLCYRIFPLKKPSRIVIDIKRCPKEP